MRNIIISSGYKDLKQLLEKNKEEYCYIKLENSPFAIEEFLKQRGYCRLDIREGLGKIDFRTEYIDFIGKLNRCYNSIHWWANSISYKGTFVSDLYQKIYHYYCLVSLITRYDRNFIIISNDLLLNKCISKYCIENGIECVSLGRKSKNNRILHFRKCLFSALYFLLKGWRHRFSISLHLSRKIEKSLKRNDFYYVIKSWIDKRSFSSNAAYRDLYFGSLPEYLKQKKKELIILVGSLSGYNQLITKIKSIEGFLVIPQEYFVGYLDYLKVSFSTFINRPKIKKIMFHDLEVTDLVKQCLDKDYENNEINENLIYYYCIRGLLKKIKVKNFIYVFENRAWERMSILAARRHSPSTKIVGYVHSSIRQSFLGYFQSKEEKDIVPSPDKILTVGEEPMLMLAQSGNYNDSVELSEGCALRYEYFFRNNKIERDKKGRVLVAFPIDLSYSLRLLEFLKEAFGEKYKYRIALRSHPFTPIETLIEKYNLSLNNNFKISETPTLEQDLKDVSALIYVDSTSCMEALMRGVPVIHVDFKESLNRDPLFKLNSLKWTVSDERKLHGIIDHIYNMDEEEYLREYKHARAYLKSYFYPIKEKYLEKFVI